MSRLRSLRTAAALAAAALALPLLTVTSSAAGAAGQARSSAWGGGLPGHIFAPYFEAYLTGSPAALSAESGAKYLTLAFIQTPKKGSCTIDWNGDKSTPISWSVYGSDIAAIRAAGGDVIPSFGGYSADHGGTEIADSCRSVPKIAAAYEKVITTYHVTRLDLDTEDNSLTNKAGISRRNAAIHLVEQWAARCHRRVQFVYTVPTNVAGLDPTGVSVLRSAVAHHARIDIVNIMTFDYYDNKPHEMARDTMTAAGHLYGTLHQLYPVKSARQLWHMIGVTEMIGIDDFGPPEIFQLSDGPVVLHWATAKGLGELSFWALQRDNGGCPGTAGSNTCSGLKQSTWQFSHIFEPFTNR